MGMTGAERQAKWRERQRETITALKSQPSEVSILRMEIAQLKLDKQAAETARQTSATHLVDGTELKPQPIVVCGETIFPSKHSRLAYPDAYIWAQHCHEVLTELPRDMSPKLIGVHIAHLGKKIARHYPHIGSFIQTIGVGIQARGATDARPRDRWIDMEAFHQPIAKAGRKAR